MTLSNYPTDFVIITALAEELTAVLDKLPERHRTPQAKDDNHTYYQADLPITFTDGTTSKYYIIVTCLMDMGQARAIEITKDVIRRWHPRYIVLVGIAGGIAANKVKIGDILIPDQIVGYELQKLSRGKTESRWNVQRADASMFYAGINFQRENWQKLIKVKRPEQGEPICHIGPIASGNKVIANDKEVAKLLKCWPNLIGVEMEAAGVAMVAFQSPDKPGFFMVRGVSDLADEKKDEKWHPYASDAAASFVIALLSSGPIPKKNKEETQNEYIQRIRKLSLPIPMELWVETPHNGQIVRDEDLPLSASGTYYSENEFNAWVILDDEHGSFYLQDPPIEFLDENHWKATNIQPGDGIEHIHFIYVDEQGNSEFHDRARKKNYGKFTELPPNSRFLCTISINRVT